jgi:hypothetical protein
LESDSERNKKWQVLNTKKEMELNWFRSILLFKKFGNGVLWLKKIGLFLHGELMVKYPNVPQSYMEVVTECQQALEETGILHEIKFFDE